MRILNHTQQMQIRPFVVNSSVLKCIFLILGVTRAWLFAVSGTLRWCASSLIGITPTKSWNLSFFTASSIIRRVYLQSFCTFIIIIIGTNGKSMCFGRRQASFYDWAHLIVICVLVGYQFYDIKSIKTFLADMLKRYDCKIVVYSSLVRDFMFCVT